MVSLTVTIALMNCLVNAVDAYQADFSNVKWTVRSCVWTIVICVIVTKIATTTLMNYPFYAMDARPGNFLSVLWTAKRYALQMAASVMVLCNARLRNLRWYCALQ